MNDRYRLGGLDDEQLLAALSHLVRRENDNLSELLAHLAELDERGLCIALGYPSLFAYCTAALGFCKSSAGRRIAAARVCRAYPEAFSRVANGELQLSVLCVLRPHLNSENASELFAACSRKSYEQVEELLAARFPKPDVQDLIRHLPVPHIRTPYIGSKDAQPDARYPQPKAVTLAVPLPDSKSASIESPPMPVDRSRPRGQRGALKPLSLDRFSVNFTADGEFRELLEEVRALLSHAEPQGDLLSVMKRGLNTLRAELLKKRFGVGRQLRRVRLGASLPREKSGSPEPQAPKRTRHVPAAVTREVYARDQGRCTFCAEGGRRCEARRLLQLDHIVPYAEGGEPTVTNLRLRCRAHNLHAARAHFGKEHVRAATERARERTRCASSSVPAGAQPARIELPPAPEHEGQPEQRPDRQPRRPRADSARRASSGAE